MSQPIQQPVQPPRRPVVQLPTWVNVVLVLILLASCGGASDRDDVNESQIADSVVNRLQQDTGSGMSTGPASAAEIEDLCRLLGAVAAKQKVPLTVMDQTELTRCHEVAQEAATP